MKTQKILVSLLLLLVTTLACTAEELTHILYSAEADVNGDGVPERLMIGSQASPDPTLPTEKEFVICEKQGERYVAVFRSSLGSAQFSTGLSLAQWEDPSTGMPGISVRQNKGVAPEIFIVITPSSDDFLLYQCINGKYQEIVEEDPS